MMRKMIAEILIASQMVLAVAAASADTPAPRAAATPEAALLLNVFALQGENLSSADAQTQMEAVVNTYLATAPATGSQERFQQALVDLGIYTPVQAQAFVKDADAASARVLSEASVSSTPAQALLTSEMTEFAALHLSGAQFSSCNEAASDVAMTGLITGLAGVGVTATGAIAGHQDVTIGGVTLMGVGLIIELAAVIMNARC